MDVQYLIFTVVTLSFCNVSVVRSLSGPETLEGSFNLEANGDLGKCKTKISTCKIQSGDHQFLVKSGGKGDKGDKGDNGIPGLPGLTGQKGDTGAPGLNGLPGAKGDNGMPGLNGVPGEKGDRGDPGATGPRGPPGDIGLQGLPGLKGDRGEQGIIGLPGIPGPTGEKGAQGPRGNVGPPGIPGSPGVCPCFPQQEIIINEDNDDAPLNTVCKSASVNSGLYNFTSPRTFEAYCNMTTRMTCLKENRSNPGDKYLRPKGMEAVLWLSQMNAFNITEVYGLDRDQILWLQTQSTSAEQTLRIHTKNLIAYDKIGNNHIHLLTWNEKIIGPMPTPESPFFYSVLDNDGTCVASTNKSEWCSVDINLVSEGSNRLPIIDIRLNDITNDEDQYVYVENIELCFG